MTTYRSVVVLTELCRRKRLDLPPFVKTLREDPTNCE